MTLTEPTPQATAAVAASAAPTLTQDETIASLGTYGYGWADSDEAGASAKRGLSDAVVADISAKKNEPEWMLEQRLKALRIFDRKPMPHWGAELDEIDFDNIKYFVRSTEKQAESWEDLPEDIRNTYDRLGIPRRRSSARRRCRGPVRVGGRLPPDPRGPGGEGCHLPRHRFGPARAPELFQQYFGSVIPAGDNKFSALNTAVWSGGSFIYVPPGVRRHPTAGLLPDQHREHGPVRADADHR